VTVSKGSLEEQRIAPVNTAVDQPLRGSYRKKNECVLGDRKKLGGETDEEIGGEDRRNRCIRKASANLPEHRRWTNPMVNKIGEWKSPFEDFEEIS